MPRHLAGGNLVCVLLCLFSLVVSGCRQDVPVSGPGESIHLQLEMNVGDRYRFDRWALDQYGYPYANGRLEELWRVTQTGAAVQGQTGVTVIEDSGAGTSSGSIYFWFAPSGELYQYGFLEMVMRQMGAGKTTPRWDRLLPSDLRTGVLWVVGVADSASTDTVYGSFNIVPEYFSAQLNGVSNVFSAYRIDLQSQRIQYTYWITDSPTCIPGFREESTEFGSGFEAFLSSATLSSQEAP